MPFGHSSSVRQSKRTQKIRVPELVPKLCFERKSGYETETGSPYSF